MDYTTLPLGCDISHYQGTPDFPTLAAAGVGFVIIKATEGMAVDPMFASNAKAALSAGLMAYWYPFLTPDDDDAVVQNAISVAADNGLNVPGLDWEEAGVPDAVVERWINGYMAKANRSGLAYYGLYPPDSVSALIASWPRWFPEYAPQPRIPAWDGVSVPDWSSEWLIWQNTGNGREPGVTTAIDLNRCAVPLTTLQAWHDTGSFTPAPPIAA